MPELSILQFELVYNVLSFSFATMFAAGLFFILIKNDLAPSVRISMALSAVVVWIAGYHYWMIFESWQQAYELSGGSYVPTGDDFNYAYRYVDWFLTVPLLMAELVLVMKLPSDETKSLLWKLVPAAALMILLGYPGEVAQQASVKWTWWGLSMIPFLYIYYVLLAGLQNAKSRQSPQVSSLINTTIALTVIVWLFYPIAYLLPVLGLGGASAEVGLQIGNSVADILAKAGYGVLIYFIASAKTEEADWSPGQSEA